MVGYEVSLKVQCIDNSQVAALLTAVNSVVKEEQVITGEIKKV